MRVEGWEMRLFDLIERARTKRFRWGHHDCVLFALDCFKALRGEYPKTLKIRGTYKSKAEAQLIIDNLNVDGSLERAVDLILGDRLDSPLFARRGDIAIYGRDAPALGVVVGAYALFVSQNGLTPRTLSECSVAWGVR